MYFLVPVHTVELTRVATRVATKIANDQTDLVLWDAVDAHDGDGGEHHADGEQAEELTGDGVARVLQGQPQTLPYTPTAHLLKQLHVSDSGRESWCEGSASCSRSETHTSTTAIRWPPYLFRSDISSTDVSMLLASLSSSQLRRRLLSSLRSW